MCGIFGILNYKNKLKDINAVIESLAVESAIRGTDATGVAYPAEGKIIINKDAVSAYKFKAHIPKYVKAAIGHTRHSTQGDKSKRYNNHPWRESVSNCSFALAHNGVLSNDKLLQKQYNLQTKVQTDSYIAVQLLKLKNKLNFDSIKYMAETIEGSFSFNIVDNKNNIYLVKGDSPLCIIHFKELGVYAFASTEEILWKGLIDTELFMSLRKGNYSYIQITEGDIIRINNNGRIDRSEFEYNFYYGSHWYDSFSTIDDSEETAEYLDTLKRMVMSYGENPDIIDELYMQGISPEEIEFLYLGAEM